MKNLITIIIVALFIATPALADDVIDDDQIVRGSECVGLDCVNGEQFGFTTLSLKENNTRMLFFDTSSSSAFPSTDWMLVANDSTNGGRNRFSIEDATAQTSPFTVAGGASTDTLFVGRSGTIGVGTNAPDRTVHIASGDSPTIRLEQTAAVGWPNYSWDLGTNEANFFVRDVESGTLPLRVLGGADDNTLVIEGGGNVSVAGTLSQGSSRAIKHRVVPVKPEIVLEKVRNLNINRWQYRQDSSGAVHMGPMAEDFREAFGLGKDAQHLAASDMAAVAVASMQALSNKVDQQEQELLRTKLENAQLKKRLERIEALLASGR